MRHRCRLGISIAPRKQADARFFQSRALVVPVWKGLRMYVTPVRAETMLSAPMRRLFLLLVGLALGLASSACSSATNAAAANATDSGAPSADAMTAADGAAPCSAPADLRPEGGTCVLQVTGTVEDLSGAPLNLVMTFCGLACYGGHSDDSGAFTIAVGDFFPTENYGV